MARSPDGSRADLYVLDRHAIQRAKKYPARPAFLSDSCKWPVPIQGTGYQEMRTDRIRGSCPQIESVVKNCSSRESCLWKHGKGAQCTKSAPCFRNPSGRPGRRPMHPQCLEDLAS